MELQHAISFSAFRSVFLHVIILYSLILMQPTGTIGDALGNDADRFALLKFKESIRNDPHGVLSTWNDSTHFCNWLGITCGKRHQRITTLNLVGYDLHGILSPYIGNLSFLMFINLDNNTFHGEIPQSVGRLFRLQVLNLSYNMLEGNIPANLSYCSKLRILRLLQNKLTGMIPFELGSLGKLMVLNVGKNNLTGGIPPTLGNISSLTIFSIVYNNLAGHVPDDLGRLKNLAFLALVSNNLSGIIPFSLYNTSSMRIFSSAENHLEGTLPPNIGLMLPNLQKFEIGYNQFSGRIPVSLSNASQLDTLDMLANYFFGQVPTNLGNLLDLRKLGLYSNSLGNYSANSLDFILSLTNCSQMTVLDLSSNNFGGVLPHSLTNLSTRLTKLFLGDNQISGNIPATIGNLINLIILSSEKNLVTGVIPPSLGRLQNLQVLDLSMNDISGKIPSSIGNFTLLYQLHFGQNRLEGSIPPSIANCQNLQYLNFSNNNLTGAIPKEVIGLFSHIELDFSKNSLIGSIPVEVGKLKHINKLDLSENNLTSEIPETIGDCETVEYLYLQGNFFQGTLPSALSSLRSLRRFDISRNNLTGEIPKDLQKLQFLLYFNLSFNDLEGEVPNKGIFQNTSAISVGGNTKLCGGVPRLELPPCPFKSSDKRRKARSKLPIIIACVAAFSLLFSSFLLFYWRRKSTRKSSSELSTISFLSKVSYKSLYQSTGAFSPSMLIGTGSFGSVYKGNLDQDENPVAVKVLNLQRKGASKSFIAECNALRNIRHRNLVKILTCCSSVDYNNNDFKALVFEYMSNGSLEKWLHSMSLDKENPSIMSLNLIQRLNIAIDVANDQPIIHCDLKPSNVLLDSEMTAHVGDFGLARLISKTIGSSESKTSTIGIKGTIGYAPPEYAMGGEPSKQGDTYSYGILVLEIFTGKRPTDKMFKDDFNLHNFVKMALPERLAQIVDSSLLPGEADEIRMRRENRRRHNNNRGLEIVSEARDINIENPYHRSIQLQKCLVSVLEIGLACSQESPNGRLNMGDVIRELQHIRNAYLDLGIHGQR